MVELGQVSKPVLSFTLNTTREKLIAYMSFEIGEILLCVFRNVPENIHRCTVMVTSHFLSSLVACLFSKSMASNVQVHTFPVISEVTFHARYSSYSQVSVF